MDAAKEFRDNKKAEKHKKVRMVENVGIAAIIGLSLLVLVLVLGLFVGPGPRARSGDKSVFFVASGDGASKIASKLEQDNLVRTPFAFKVLVVLTGSGSKFQIGEFEIPSRASPSKILQILTKGAAIAHNVTIPEGWTNGMAYERIAASPILGGEMPPMVREGSLAADTYQVQRGDTRATLVNRMVQAQTRIIDELWLKRAANLPFRSKDEAIILASIVEKETGKAEERPRVAAVFINRLRLGMKLQSDPTIIYGVTRGLPIGRKILRSEINQNHPWNTYVIAGLPPTPIANPGRASIEAVLNPPNTKDLFFVADGTGGHVFAETYAEHERNVARWRAFRAQSEIQEQRLEGARGSK